MAFVLRFVIPDPSGRFLLLVENATGWTLPRVVAPGPFGEEFLVTGVAAETRAQFGVDIVLLRSVLVEYSNTDEDSGQAIFFTQNLSQRTPRVGEWCDERSLVQLDFADERERPAVQQWFVEKRHGRPPSLAPWGHEGWFEDATSWISSELPGVTEVEQYRVWSGSALLRIDADDGRYFFKSAPDIFHREAIVTSLIAERFPQVVPTPVAIDEARGWMLLEDFGDTFVAGLALDHWEKALAALLELQRGSIPMVGSLLQEGIVDRRPDRLTAQIEELAEGGLGELREERKNCLVAGVPRLKELSAELGESPIPSTLVHGDFHAGNVVVTDGRYMIFDWTDACIAHPFVDLATFLYMFGPPSTDAAVRNRLRDRYLQGWSDVMPHDEAVDLFERTEPVAAVHHAISYQTILASLDPSQRWEWASHLPWWLERALGAGK